LIPSSDDTADTSLILEGLLAWVFRGPELLVCLLHGSEGMDSHGIGLGNFTSISLFHDRVCCLDTFNSLEFILTLRSFFYSRCSIEINYFSLGVLLGSYRLGSLRLWHLFILGSFRLIGQRL